MYKNSSVRHSVLFIEAFLSGLCENDYNSISALYENTCYKGVYRIFRDINWHMYDFNHYNIVINIEIIKTYEKYIIFI